MSLFSQIRKYKVYEHDGDRCRFFFGDLHAWDEHESGFRRGPDLSFEIGFYDHTGEFDELVYGEHWERDSRWYLSHWASMVIWRWGFSLIVRGKRIRHDWDSLDEVEE